MRPQVVIVPGLWMPSPLMWLLAARLEAAGYAARVFSYSGRGPHEANVESLARFAREGGAFVGHSLGGVLVLDMLSRHTEIEARSVVLLGAPVRGCLAGRRLGERRIGRWMLGACRALWDERPPQRWTRATPLGIVAGTLPFGLGRAVGGALPGANDGVVCVEETTVEGMADRALVRQGHSMLICASSVAKLVERFLSAGRFA
jgi:pimeloyl-ACP methyl ester carboxylesterase